MKNPWTFERVTMAAIVLMVLGVGLLVWVTAPADEPADVLEPATPVTTTTVAYGDRADPVWDAVEVSDKTGELTITVTEQDDGLVVVDTVPDDIPEPVILSGMDAGRRLLSTQFDGEVGATGDLPCVDWVRNSGVWPLIADKFVRAIEDSDNNADPDVDCAQGFADWYCSEQLSAGCTEAEYNAIIADPTVVGDEVSVGGEPCNGTACSLLYKVQDAASAAAGQLKGCDHNCSTESLTNAWNHWQTVANAKLSEEVLNFSDHVSFGICHDVRCLIGQGSSHIDNAYSHKRCYKDSEGFGGEDWCKNGYEYAQYLSDTLGSGFDGPLDTCCEGSVSGKLPCPHECNGDCDPFSACAVCCHNEAAGDDPSQWHWPGCSEIPCPPPADADAAMSYLEGLPLDERLDLTSYMKAYSTAS